MFLKINASMGRVEKRANANVNSQDTIYTNLAANQLFLGKTQINMKHTRKQTCQPDYKQSSADNYG